MDLKRSDELKAFLRDLSSDRELDFTDLNAVDSLGDNALDAALWSEHFAIARELIELGIDLNAHGDLGKTPVHVAATRGYVEILQLMVEKDADLFALDEGSYTPIMSAALRKQENSVAYLRTMMKRSPEVEAFLEEFGKSADEIALPAAILDEKLELVRELVFLSLIHI